MSARFMVTVCHLLAEKEESAVIVAATQASLTKISRGEPEPRIGEAKTFSLGFFVRPGSSALELALRLASPYLEWRICGVQNNRKLRRPRG